MRRATDDPATVPPPAPRREEPRCIEVRLSRLERSETRWRRSALALGAVLAFLVLAGQSPAGRTVEAAAVIVRDPGSGARVQLSAADGMPSIALHDATGHLRAAVAIEENSPLFSLYSTGGEPRVVVGQRGGAAFVIVRDAEGAPRAAMAVQESGAPSLYLLDANLDPLFRQPPVTDRD